MKVQVTSAPLLKISAQRQITENKWRRIYKEFPVPFDCDANDITAKFENGTLKIIFRRLITPIPSPIANPQETTSSKPPERDEFDEKSGAKENQEDVSEDTQKEKESPSDDFTEEVGKTGDGIEEKKAKTSDDEVSGKTPEKSDNGVDEKKAKTSDDEVSGKTPEANKKEKESAESGDFTKKNGKTVAADEAASNAIKAHEEKQRTKNFVTRTKTRMLDFTLSLRPPVDQDYRESLAGMVTGLKRMRKLMYLILVSLMVVVLGLYVKNAFKSSSSSSLGGSEVQEL